MKTYLNNFDELKKAYVSCNALQSRIFNLAYEDCMNEQEYTSDYVGASGIRWNSHYTSFFYTIENRKAFLVSALYHVDCEYYYGITTEEKERILKAFNHFEYEMDYGNKQYDNLDNWLDKKANEMLKNYETILHNYENQVYEESYIDDMIANVYTDIFRYHYVTDNDYTKVYIHIPEHEERMY